MTEKTTPKVFVSYSWDDEDHKQWVLKLAKDLVSRFGIDVDLDQWDVKPGDLITIYMEQIKQDDNVVVVCSRGYLEKAKLAKGGVAYEGMIIRDEIASNLTTNKFIPIIRNNESDDLPVYMAGRMYIDFRVDDLYEEKIEELARKIHKTPKIIKPPLGPNPFALVRGNKDEVFGRLVEQAEDLKVRIEKLGIQYLAEPNEEGGRRYYIPIFNFLKLREEPEEIGAKPYFNWAHDFHKYLHRIKDYAEFSGVPVDAELNDYWKLINLHLGKVDYWKDFDDFNVPPKIEEAEKELEEFGRLLDNLAQNLQDHIDRLKILHANLSDFTTDSAHSKVNVERNSFSNTNEDISNSLDVKVGVRLFGAGSRDERDELTIILTNNWFEPIQIVSISGRWWPLDGKYYESELQFTGDSNIPPQVLEPTKSMKITFQLTPQEIQRSKLPINQYPLDQVKGNQRASHFIYEFLVKFRTRTVSDLERIFSYSFSDEKLKFSSRRSFQGSSSERARANEFKESYDIANSLRESDPNEAIAHYGAALPFVSGYWDSNTEERKLFSRIWLWTLLMHEAFHWTNFQLRKPEYIEKAESIFRNDEEFFKACKIVRMDFNSEIDLAAMIFCWSKANNQSEVPQERKNWLEKAKDHAINAKSHFHSTSMTPIKRTRREKVAEAFLTSVTDLLLKEIDKQLENQN